MKKFLKEGFLALLLITGLLLAGCSNDSSGSDDSKESVAGSNDSSESVDSNTENSVEEALSGNTYTATKAIFTYNSKYRHYDEYDYEELSISNDVVTLVRKKNGDTLHTYIISKKDDSTYSLKTDDAEAVDVTGPYEGEDVSDDAKIVSNAFFFDHAKITFNSNFEATLDGESGSWKVKSSTEVVLVSTEGSSPYDEVVITSDDNFKSFWYESESYQSEYDEQDNKTYIICGSSKFYFVKQS